MMKWVLFFALIFSSVDMSHAQDAIAKLPIENKQLRSDSLRLAEMHQTTEKYLRMRHDSAFYFAQLHYDSALNMSDNVQQVNALINMGNAQINIGRYQEGNDKLEEARKLASEIGWKKGRAKALLHLGNLKSRQAQYNEALQFCTEALALFEELNDTQGVSDCLNGLGIAYKNKGKYREALNCYAKCLSLAEDSDDKRSKMAVLNNIASIYYELGETSKVIEYLNESLEITEELEHKPAMTSMLNNLGLIHIENGNYTKALEYLDKSAEVSQGLSLKRGTAARLSNLGLLYFKTGEYEKAKSYNDQGLELYEELGYKSGVIKVLVQQADLGVELGKIARQNKEQNRAIGYYTYALEKGERALDLSQEVNSLEMMSKASLALYNTYKGLNNKTLALSMFEQHVQQRDSLKSEENERAIIRLEYQYEYEKQAAADSIRALNAHKITEALLSKEKSENYILLLCVAFLFLIAIVVGGVYVKKVKDSKRLLGLHQEVSKQKDKLEILNREKNGLIGIISHDLRSPLSSLSGILQIMKFSTDKEIKEEFMPLMEQLIVRMSDMVSRILDVSALETKSMNLRLETIDINQLINKVVVGYEAQAEKKEQRLIYNTQETLEVRLDKNFVIGVLENLISNAIKYSPQKANITIELKPSDRSFKILIIDQGPGIKPNEQDKLFSPFALLSTKPTGGESSTGLGLSIAKKLVEAMGGKIWCNSTLGEGSTFGFELPK